jgi:2-hydroxychromene-2-carboxylate isomerase
MASTFYYDFQSPYAYLAAHQVDERVTGEVRWQPIMFAGLLRATGRAPWSWNEGPARDAEMRACERKAAALGLPLRWPREWPRGTYSILVLRAALVAAEHDRLRELSLAAFRHGLGLGRDLTELDVVLEVAAEADVDPALVREGVERPEIKQRLREATEAAVARGVVGIPTVAVGERLFWGEDRLGEAAQAAAAAG